MDIIYEIRRRHLVQKQYISAIARDMWLSRPTMRKHLKTLEEPRYERGQATSPKLGQFEELLTKWLTEEARLPPPRRRTAHRLFEGLQQIGYSGAYDSVQRFVKQWKAGNMGPMSLPDANILHHLHYGQKSLRPCISHQPSNLHPNPIPRFAALRQAHNHRPQPLPAIQQLRNGGVFQAR